MKNLRYQLSILLPFSLVCLCTVESFTQQQWTGPINNTDIISRIGTVGINGGIRGENAIDEEFKIIASYTNWDGATITMTTWEHPINPGGIDFNNRNGWFSFNCLAGQEWVQAMRINRDRTVGIGTSIVPNGYLLAVKSGIISEKVRVELCGAGGWCDYVFGADYPLLSLHELQTFIDKNHHLPGMPSGASIESDGGFELKDMTIRQQEKIEELFLYVIQLKEEIDQLKLQLELKTD